MSLTSYRAAPPRANLNRDVQQPDPFWSTASLSLGLWLLHPAPIEKFLTIAEHNDPDPSMGPMA